MKKILPISTVTIAVASLALALWQGYAYIQHNRLSVTPHLELKPMFNADDPYYGISLVNNGIGPAVLTNIQICIAEFRGDKRVYKQVSTYDAIDALRAIGYTGSLARNHLAEGGFIAVGSTTRLFYLLEEAMVDHKEFSKYLSLIRIHIEYESLHGDSFQTTTWHHTDETDACEGTAEELLRSTQKR